MTLFIAGILIALGVSFLCSVAEAVVLSLTPTQVASISARYPSIGAIWQGFKERIDRPIAVILLWNTAAHTIGASVAGSQFDQLYGDQWIWAFSLVFTYAMFQFAEILPKTLGVRFNRELALVMAQPMALVIRLFTPILRVIHLVNRPFEIGQSKEQRSVTMEEIASLTAMARLSNQIGSHQERIILGASKLSRQRVSQVMIPADDVTFLSTSQTLNEAFIAAHIDAHTRFPVCEGNDRNRVVGYVNFKEMVYFMRTNPQDPSFTGIIRPVHFVSPDSIAADLLKVFVDQHVHMAVVRDNEGRTLGMVALEDLVEELVGELEDEFDRLPRHVHQLSGGMWLVGGGVPMKDLGAKLGVTIADATGSVAEWLSKHLAADPKPGLSVKHDGLEFQIRRVRRGRVFEASVFAGTSARPF